jgi:hypothetical protein
VDTSGVVILKYEDCTAVCVAAKDSAAPNLQIIQGDQGATLVMDAKPNSCGPYAIHSTGGRSQHFDNTVHPHRMYEEFVEFERMIREHDLAERDSRLNHSHLVLEVALSAMASVGINPGSPALEQESLFTSDGAKVSGEAARSQLPA